MKGKIDNELLISAIINKNREDIEHKEDTRKNYYDPNYPFTCTAREGDTWKKCKFGHAAYSKDGCGWLGCGSCQNQNAIDDYKFDTKKEVTQIFVESEIKGKTIHNVKIQRDESVEYLIIYFTDYTFCRYIAYDYEGGGAVAFVDKKEE